MLDFLKKWRCAGGVLVPIDLTRRKLLVGLGATLVAAPAIVSFEHLMPVKALLLPKPPIPMMATDLFILQHSRYANTYRLYMPG